MRIEDRSAMYEVHGHHDLPRRIYGDDCHTCVARATGGLDGLGMLDTPNLEKLGDLAAEIHAITSGQTARDRRQGGGKGVSHADRKAVETLRWAARITFGSGITEEVAR